jgi:hypothetical protein
MDTRFICQVVEWERIIELENEKQKPSSNTIQAIKNTRTVEMNACPAWDDLLSLFATSTLLCIHLSQPD